MLVARRPISIGNETFATGDRITRSAQNQLPPGRMPQLIEHGWIEELVDEIAVERRVDFLERAVDDLRAQVAKLSGTKPRRRTKAQDEDDQPVQGPASTAPIQDQPDPGHAVPGIDDVQVPGEPLKEMPGDQGEPPPDKEDGEQQPDQPEQPQPDPAETTQPSPSTGDEAKQPVWDPIDQAWKSEDEMGPVAAGPRRRR